ncbi:hypothetical protein MKW98_020793 [Papaver atlanticum]|uniref:Uncharacterized protein n=1 Tax=Papaver atlanticum TaxID=357466 RepID=A0AAD4TIR5_9MAGN|nr:hypothetical protein MKW98_020793 [Papaver atlanticum]
MATSSSSSMSPSELCAAYMKVHDAVMASSRKFQKGRPNLEKLKERHTNKECSMVDEKIIDDGNRQKEIDCEFEKYVSAEPMFVKIDNFSSLLH